MQFIDLKAQYSALKREIDAAIQTVLDEGQFISGKQVEELEQQISEYLNVEHVIACANGTDALQLLYMAYGIGEGDAVFCPDITFIASIEPAAMLGAVPVFCDVSPDSFNLCPESLERQIKAVINEGSLRPSAVVVVDFLGNPADYGELGKVCDKYGLLLIEDAAQSFGASYNGKMCGSMGDSAITSFFPAKPLGCYGDGGAVMTNAGEIAELCRSLRVHGKGKSKYDNVRIGVNSRLDTLQAAILQVKLKALKEYELERRQIIAARYDEAFKGMFNLVDVSSGCVSAYAQYALLAGSAKERGSILARLEAAGIPSMVYYPNPLHTLEAFEGVQAYGETFSVSADYCKRTFSLPMHPYLGAEEQDKIIRAVLEAAE